MFNKVCGILFLCAIAVTPFNHLDRIPTLFGEFSVEAAFYPTAVALILLAISCFCGKQLLKSPRHFSFMLCFFFMGWIIISGLVNYPTILDSVNKGRTGQEKFILQCLVLIFVFITACSIFTIAQIQWNSEALAIMSGAVLVSFLIAGSYSIVEICYIYGSSWAKDVLTHINLLFARTNVLYPQRLRSVCGEASWFGNYIAFVFPWLLGCFFYSQKHRLLYSIVFGYAILMLYLSFSRTSYFIAAAEILFFLGLFIWKQRDKSVIPRLLVFLLTIIVVAVVVYLLPSKFDSFREIKVLRSFVQEEPDFVMSNVGRFGSNVAALRIGLSYPIFGVGFGQYGFYMRKFIPDWALKSSEITSWASVENGTPWPPALNLYARIWAELGLIGISIWLLIWITLFYSCFKIVKIRGDKINDHQQMYGIVLLVSIFGAFLVGFSIDTFRPMQYWILLAMVWIWIEGSTCESSS